MPEKACKDCGAAYYAQSTLNTRCPHCTYKRNKKRRGKPLKQRGKRTVEYDRWRDNVARPYLVKNFGHQCARCGVPPNVNPNDGSYYFHDVDHIKGRGSNNELRMVLSNVQFLCRPCHIKKDGGMR